ncbi:MAG: hypothetical protein R6V03_09105 [Kiritimatiellia bacterium]
MKTELAYEYLKKSVRSERAAQSYLVACEPISEGIALAERTLCLLYCEEDGDAGECPACRKVQERTHPDILWVEPEKKSRRISIEQIRDIQQRIFQSSFSGGWKACVLTGADRLSPQAANAFLKVLEEPPGRSIFFLLTDSPEFLMPTIVSRCQRLAIESDRVDLPEELADETAEILERAGEGGSTGAAAAADCVAGLLKRLKDGITEGMAESAGGEDLNRETLDARAGARYVEMRTMLWRFVLLWYRDILLLSGEEDTEPLAGKRYAETLKKAARRVTFRQALRDLTAVEDAQRMFERHIPEKSVLSRLFVKLAGNREKGKAESRKLK